MSSIYTLWKVCCLQEVVQLGMYKDDVLCAIEHIIILRNCMYVDSLCYHSCSLYKSCILPATSLDPPTSLMSGTVTATSIVVVWSGAGSPVNGYYISWRRTDLGDSATAEYARVTGVMHTMTNLFAGVTYDITVWSTDGTRVSSPVSRQVTTSESGELSPYVD